MGCQTCNTCNTCIEGYQTAEEALGKFEFRPSEGIAKGDRFLSAEEWNSLIDYIWRGYKINNKGWTPSEESYMWTDKNTNITDYIFASSSSDDTYVYPNSSLNQYGKKVMTAHMFNGVYAKIAYYTNDKEPLEYVNQGDLIQAKYFIDLEDYVNTEFRITGCKTGECSESECCHCDDCDHYEGCGDGDCAYCDHCAECDHCPDMGCGTYIYGT